MTSTPPPSPPPGEQAPEASSQGQRWRLRSIAQNAATAALLAVAVAVVVWYVMRPAGEQSVYDVNITASATGPAPKIGKEAPDFELPALGGGTLRLSDFRGQAVWVSFWATWCPPCRAENPDIEATYQKYKDRGLTIIAINLGEPEPTIAGYMERTNLTFPVALDLSTAAAATYRLVGIPTHFFVDADGILRAWRIGGLSLQQMEENVEKVLPADSTTP